MSIVKFIHADCILSVRNSHVGLLFPETKLDRELANV